MLDSRAAFTITLPSGLTALAAMQETTDAIKAAASGFFHDALSAIALVQLDFPEFPEAEDEPEF